MSNNPDDLWQPTDSVAPKNMPLSIVNQLVALRHVRRLLELQLKQDKAHVAELYEKKERIEKGGGK